MLEVFKHYGRVLDVYIARKRNKQGNRFRFSRFAGVVDTSVFEKNSVPFALEPNIYIVTLLVYQHLGDSLFNNILTTRKFIPINHHTRHTPTNTTTSKTTATTPGTSYAAMLKGTPPQLLEINPILPPPPSEQSESLIITELRSLESAPNTHNIIVDEGFSNFSIKYLGGLHLLIQFNNPKIAAKALTNPNLQYHFKTIKPWSNKIHIHDRVTWVSISGFPPHLWNTNVFFAIAKTWGEFLIPEECSARQFNHSVGKVCILTKRMDFIRESVLAPIGIKKLAICVSKFDGEIDSLFNGYTLTSSIFRDSVDESGDLSGEDRDDDRDGDRDGSEKDGNLEEDTNNAGPIMDSNMEIIGGNKYSENIADIPSEEGSI
ncbi:cytochrome P450 [Tanacetum coccineum]